jgi:uncharacterized membrane protein YkgB
MNEDETRRDDALAALARAMTRASTVCARLGLGVIFLWFGLVKLFPGASPNEALAGETLRLLSGGLLDPGAAVRALGLWESAIGVGLLSGIGLRAAILSLLVHLIGSVSPVLVCPEMVFERAPLVLTLAGQDIVKNVVLAAAALSVAGRVVVGSSAGAFDVVPARTGAPGPRPARRALARYAYEGLQLHE